MAKDVIPGSLLMVNSKYVYFFLFAWNVMLLVDASWESKAMLYVVNVDYFISLQRSWVGGRSYQSSNMGMLMIFIMGQISLVNIYLWLNKVWCT